jgi:thioredoxin-related protein
MPAMASGGAMTTRRALIAGAGALTLAGAPARRADAAIVTDDGLYREPWFIESFLELADDLETAHGHGKRLALIWELKGCPYCRQTHLVNFARPDIADYVKANFDVLLLNIIGSRKVTDFDGTEFTEKQIAAKYGVRYTPTIQFFPETVADLKGKAVDRREVTRITGYLEPDDFLAMFRYVQSHAYETQNFRDFLKAARS